MATVKSGEKRVALIQKRATNLLPALIFRDILYQKSQWLFKILHQRQHEKGSSPKGRYVGSIFKSMVNGYGVFMFLPDLAAC